MILNEGYLRALIRKTILENISEDANPAYDKGSSFENVKKIWKVIEDKQKELYDVVFGELSDKLYDVTEEKLRVMNKAFGNKYDFMQLPDTLCKAGNEKLPSGVLIINMSSSLMCPSYYLGICTITEGACYAQRAENQYSSTDKEGVLTNRWKTDLMHTQMLQQYQKGNKEPMKKYFNLIETYIQLGNAYSTNLYKQAISKMRNRLKRELTKEEEELLRIEHFEHQITDIRLNETGDFHCQLAVKLWDKFAMKIKKKYGINTHAYTARNLDFSNVSKNIAINPSHPGINLGDTKPRYFKAVDDEEYNSLADVELGENSQPILNKKYKNRFYYKCPCGIGETKCDLCGVCFKPNLTGEEYTIYVKYHGLVAANGFKHLFKQNEVNGVMDKLYQNGWITDDEYKAYNSKANKKRLTDLSKNIESQRKKGNSKSKKQTKKKRTK